MCCHDPAQIEDQQSLFGPYCGSAEDSDKIGRTQRGCSVGYKHVARRLRHCDLDVLALQCFDDLLGYVLICNHLVDGSRGDDA